MPYKSEAHRRFFNSPAGKEKIGKENVEEWNKESKGQKNLPEKVSSKDVLRKAIMICDKIQVDVKCIGEHTSFEHYAIVDISSDRIIKDNFKTEIEAIKYAKSKGYDIK